MMAPMGANPGQPQETKILDFFQKFEAGDFSAASQFFAANPEYESNGINYSMDLSNPAVVATLRKGARTAIEFAHKDAGEVWVNCIFTENGCQFREFIEIAFDDTGLFKEFSHIRVALPCPHKHASAPAPAQQPISAAGVSQFPAPQVAPQLQTFSTPQQVAQVAPAPQQVAPQTQMFAPQQVAPQTQMFAPQQVAPQTQMFLAPQQVAAQSMAQAGAQIFSAPPHGAQIAPQADDPYN
jgi:hypothetical protein